MKKESRIYVAGHTGLVGSAIVSCLEKQGYKNYIVRPHSLLNLTDEQSVNSFFDYNKPEYVFLAAAKVGGIYANSNNPADFIYENLAIQTNVIKACYIYKVKKLLFLGSSCIYPRDCRQPMKETDLLTGELEPTNEAYAIAKIAGIKMCQAYNKQHGTNFISAMPTNLYGPNDNFDIKNGHVIGSLIAKFATAKKNNQPVKILGTGVARREFLYSEDCAEALIFLMNTYNDTQIINVGSNEYSTISELVQRLCKLFDYYSVEWDHTYADGTLEKKLDTTRLERLGWKYSTTLREGLKKTLKDYYESHNCS